MLKLTLKLASLVRSNGANVQATRGSVLGDYGLSAPGVSLLITNLAILSVSSSSHFLTYLRPPRLIAGKSTPKSTKKRPALLTNRVSVDLGKALRRTFNLDHPLARELYAGLLRRISSGFLAEIAK